MKIKFLTAIIAICLTTSSFALEAQPAKSSTKTKPDTAKNVIDIKTFDFERIFREANEYFAAAKKWNTLKCIPKTRFVCSKHECPKLKMNEASALIMDKDKETLALCVNKVCQYYAAEFEQTGVFINVKVKESNSVTIRVLGDSRFKQIAMIGLDAYIANGECKVIE